MVSWSKKLEVPLEPNSKTLEPIWDCDEGESKEKSTAAAKLSQQGGKRIKKHLKWNKSVNMLKYPDCLQKAPPLQIECNRKLQIMRTQFGHLELGQEPYPWGCCSQSCTDCKCKVSSTPFFSLFQQVLWSRMLNTARQIAWTVLSPCKFFDLACSTCPRAIYIPLSQKGSPLRKCWNCNLLLLRKVGGRGSVFCVWSKQSLGSGSALSFH